MKRASYYISLKFYFEYDETKTTARKVSSEIFDLLDNIEPSNGTMLDVSSCGEECEEYDN